MTILEFIDARQAEHRRIAETLLTAARNPGKAPDFTEAGGPAAEAYRQHFAPHVMLRDIAARQRVLDRHRGCGSGVGYCDDGGKGSDVNGCAELADLASMDSGHPDYQQAWVG